MSRRASHLRALVHGLALVAVVAQGTVRAGEAEGTLPDSGFRPEGDGLSFPNYGSDPHVALRPEDLRRVFGDAVCASTAGGKCVLTPQAEEWLEVVATQSKGGHCYGFSELSLLGFAGRIDVSPFGAATVHALHLDGNEALQRELKILWSAQFFPKVVAETKSGTPSKLLETLGAALAEGKKAKDFYNVGFSKREGGGGHAVTPFAIEARGEHAAALLVYDNNWPGEKKEMLFDLAKDTWRYGASTNPDEPEGLYEGDAKTLSLWLMPVTTGKYPQEWMFTPEPVRGLGAAPAVAHNEIWLESDPDNRVHLLLTDPQGHRTGFADGKFVDEIPGARVAHVIGRDLFPHSEPVYQVPTTIDLTITLDGRALRAVATSNVVLIGPGRTTSVDAIHLDPGQVDTIRMSGDGRSVAYHTGGSETPDLKLGVENPGADYEFTIKGVALGEGGGTVTLVLDAAKNRLRIGHESEHAGTFAYLMSRIDESGERTFDDEGVELPANATLDVDYSRWDGTPSGAIDVTIDRGDGKPPAAMRLENEKK